jgi:hypothetical protein
VIASLTVGDIAGLLGGAARVTFLIADISAILLWLAASKDRSIALARLIFALAAGVLLYNVLAQPRFEDDPWKFGYGIPVTLIAIALAVKAVSKGRSRTAFILVLAFAALNLVLFFRSMGLILLSAAMLTLIYRCRRGHKPLGPASLAILCALSFLFVTGYGLAAYDGYLGQAAQLKIHQQVGKSVTPYRILVSGRKELATSIVLLWRSPLQGVGADHHLTAAESNEMIDVFASRGFPLTPTDVRRISPGSEYIAHSAVFAAWLEAGVLGLPAAIAITITLVRAVLRRPAVGGIASTALIINSAWGLFFSPAGGIARVLLAVGIAIALIQLWTSEIHPAVRHRTRPESCPSPSGGRKNGQS